MAKTIRYQKMVRMEPRPGVKYATVYIKQTPQQRQELVNHIRLTLDDLSHIMETYTDINDYVMEVPQRDFKRSDGTCRSIIDIILDMVNEATGRRRDGNLKDFALAPIERWNKLFRGTPREIILVQAHGPRANTFNNIMEIKQ